MNKFYVIVCLISTGLVFSACTTPSKASKPEYLSGDSSDLLEKDILENISRTIYVKRKVKLSPSESQSTPERPAGPDYRGVDTSTWVKVYPYTAPLIRTRVKEIAFKERWDDSKTQSVISADVKRLVEDKQCFALEINSEQQDAIKIIYWAGTLQQGSKTQPLSFSKGSGIVETTTHTSTSGYMNYGIYHGSTSSYDTKKYFYYADACGISQIDILGEFSLELEPRFEKELLPIKLQWLLPTKTKKGQNSQPFQK